MLRTRIDFTRLCQFNIKQEYRLRDCARGGGSNFGLMTHLFKAGSPDLRRLQITTLHAGGVAFWAKFSILLNMDFKIKRDVILCKRRLCEAQSRSRGYLVHASFQPREKQRDGK